MLTEDVAGIRHTARRADRSRATSRGGMGASAPCRWRGLEALEPRTMLSAALTYTSEYLGDGLIGYTFAISCDDGLELSYAATLGFRGAGGASVYQMLFGGVAPVHTQADADILHGLGEEPYDKTRDSWVFSPFGDNPLPGFDPFTGEFFSGFQESGSTFVISAGTGAGSQLGDGVNVAYIVADGDVEWAGTAARSGVDYATSGVTGVEGAIVVTVDVLTTRSSSPALSGLVSDADAVVTVALDGQTYHAVNNGDGTWTLQAGVVAPLGDGTYDVAAWALNEQTGATGADGTTGELTVTNEPPAVTFDVLVTNAPSPALGGTVDDTTADVTVMINGQIYQAVNNADGTWALAAGVLAPMADGVYDVTVTARDALGNSSTHEAPGALTVDTVAPDVTVDLTPTFDNTPALSGTVNDPTASIEVTIAGQTYEAVNNGDGTWTLADNVVAALAYSDHQVTVQARDAAGNVQTAGGQLSIQMRVVLGGEGGIVRVTYVDEDGTNVTVSFVGGRGGEAWLVFSGEALSLESVGRRVAIYGGTSLEEVHVVADSRALILAARGGTVDGTTIGLITGDAVLGRLLGRSVDLVGRGIDMPDGMIEMILLRDIQADITMGGTAARGVRLMALRDIAGANILVASSDIASLIAGRMVDSSVFAGVQGSLDAQPGGVYELPAADLGERTIRLISVRGYRGAEGDLFANTNIAASAVGTVLLRDVGLENTETPFGIAAGSVRNLRLRQGRAWYSHARRWPAEMGDFTVRLV